MGQEDSIMKRRHHTPEQIIRKLAEGDRMLNEGSIVDQVASHLEITASTWHRWSNQYGGMKADDAKRLKELEKENQRLKELVANQALDIDMLKELAEANLRPRTDAVEPSIGSRSGSGSPNAGPVRWSANPGPPNASRHPPPGTTSSPSGGSSATSPPSDRAGVGDVRPRRPEMPAGPPTPSGSNACGGTRA